MPDLHARLAENQQIIEAATEGPWEVDAYDPTYIAARLPNDEQGEDGATVFFVTEGVYHMVDAEFIAAARTEWARVNAALRKVLELHQPTDLVGGTGCERCLIYVDAVDDAVHEAWPCPTVKAIEEEME